jgi:hypothetical protein
MADIYSLLMGEEPSSSEQAKMLSQQLRGQRGVGELALLTGDPVLGQFGQSRIAGAGQQEGNLAQAGGQRLSRATALLQQQRGLGATSRENALDRALDREKFGMTQEAARLKQAAEASEGLRKELMGNQVTKSMFEVGTAFKKVETAANKPNPTPPDDMSLIFGYMKMLDPGSSVREGEYANASNTTGVSGQVLNMYNKAIDGKLLNDTQRKQFLGSARDAYGAHLQGYQQLAGQYRGLAEKSGAKPDDVVMDVLGLGGAVGPQTASPQEQAPAGRPSRTVGGETRYWDGKAWGK